MKYESLHTENKKWARNFKGSEQKLFLNLLEVQETEAYRDFDYPGLFTYAIKHSELTEPTACMFRTVINHAIAFPALRSALLKNQITVSYASKIVAALTPETVDETLEFTKAHSISETQRWLVREKGAVRPSKITISTEILELFKQVKNLVPGNPSNDDVMRRMITLFQEHHDPVVKATRAKNREEQKQRGPTAPENRGGTKKPAGNKSKKIII